MDYVLYFFIYSFMGWVCECTYCSIPQKKFINRGFLAGPYCPIYGCGAMLVVYMVRPFAFNPVCVFAAAMILTSILEYITSWAMEKLFHTKWWDYSTYPFNINGRVCLKNSLMFGVMGLVVYYYMHPAAEDFISHFSMMAQILMGSVAIVMFAFDAGTTTHALLRKNQDFAEVEDSLNRLREEFREHPVSLRDDEPLSVGIQRVLDGTDADEILIEHLQNIHNMIHEKRQQRRWTRERLNKAFPNKTETVTRRKIEDVSTVLNRHFENKRHFEK